LQAKNWGIKQRSILRKWLDNFKKEGKCCKCGMTDYRCLEFHHRDHNLKEHNITRMITDKVSLERLQREMNKCDLICANCHRIEHFSVRGRIRHGTPSIKVAP
jgi:hypothetical protein